VRLRLAVSLLGALLVLGASGSAATFPGPPRVTQTVLANGLRVVVVENHAVPLARVDVWYRFGSVNDPPGHHGLAHALEHMMFRGTRAMPGPNTIDFVDARLGIERNAETDYDSTHYYATVPVDELPVALRIDADRMRGLLLRPRDWALERRAVLAELSGDKLRAEETLESAVRLAAYGASSFGDDPGGHSDELLQTGVDDLRRAYDAAYRPDNATLVVSGDVDPRRVFALARTIFGPVRGHANVAAVPSEHVRSRGFVVRLNSVAERIVDVALESHGQLAADGSAEGVAAELLDSTHAVARAALIDSGPCASYDVDDDTQLYGGLYHVLCHLDSAVGPTAAIRSIRRTLRQLAVHPPRAAIEYARRADIAASAFARDSLASEATFFGSSFALQHTDPRQFDVDTAHVSDAEVAAVFRRWSDPVGVGIATGSFRISIRDEPGRKTRAEHVSPPAHDDSDVEPAWTRAAAVPLRSTTSTPVETFALPNGLRVFVEPRRGNGTVYIEAGFDQAPNSGRLALQQVERSNRIAERNAIVLESGLEPAMHGFAREFPTMLGLVAGIWKAAPRAGLRPDRAWIVVVGDIDPLTVRVRVAQFFGGWHVAAVSSPQPSPSPRPWLARRGRNRILTIHLSAPSIRAAFLQAAPGRDDPDFAAMTILNEALGGDADFDSRLVRDLRTRRALVYSVASAYDAGDKMLMVTFEAPRRDFPAARAAVRGVLERMRSNGVTVAEAQRARHKLLAKALRAEAGPNGVLRRLVRAARRHEPPEDLATLAARYDAVTLDDLNRVARTRLTPDTVTELVEGQIP
jgi:predicted Zn-dependent peptidase